MPRYGPRETRAASRPRCHAAATPSLGELCLCNLLRQHAGDLWSQTGLTAWLYCATDKKAIEGASDGSRFLQESRECRPASCKTMKTHTVASRKCTLTAKFSSVPGFLLVLAYAAQVVSRAALEPFTGRFSTVIFDCSDHVRFLSIARQSKRVSFRRLCLLNHPGRGDYFSVTQPRSSVRATDTCNTVE